MTDVQVSTKERLVRGAMILTLQDHNPDARGIHYAARRVVDWEMLDLEMAQIDEDLRALRAKAGCV